MISRQFMSIPSKQISPNDICDELLNVYDGSAEFLPVVLESKFLGFFCTSKVERLKPLVSDYELLYTSSISSQAHFFDIIARFSENKSDILAVHDENENFCGIIHLKKFIETIANINAVWSPGGVVILEIHPSDFHLSEIAQIAESNDASILAMFMYPSVHGSTNEVVLKFNKEDLDSILGTFERYAYSVKSVFTENQPDDDLLERYNSLMNYLNI